MSQSMRFKEPHVQLLGRLHGAHTLNYIHFMLMLHACDYVITNVTLDATGTTAQCDTCSSLHE